MELYLAHLGGAGGYNDVSAAVLNGFQTLRQARPEFSDALIRFDLSGAILAEAIDGMEPTSDENCLRLAEHIRQAGIDRFLFASDYPVFSVEQTQQTLRNRLPLKEDELNTLLHSSSRRFDLLKEIQLISHPDLRRELLKRVARDQAIRKALFARPTEGSGPPAFDTDAVEEMTRIDDENRQWLTEQVQRHGWPGRSMVATDGAHAAWLLVQHADRDRMFQERCLERMQAAGADEVSATDIAYLTDRVLIGQGKPQRYGTQASIIEGKIILSPCEDPDKLDQRRSELGLAPVADYLETMRKEYGMDGHK
jgi:hypothetical protein